MSEDEFSRHVVRLRECASGATSCDCKPFTKGLFCDKKMIPSVLCCTKQPNVFSVFWIQEPFSHMALLWICTIRRHLVHHIIIIPAALSLPLLRSVAVGRASTIFQNDWFCTRTSNFFQPPPVFPIVSFLVSDNSFQACCAFLDVCFVLLLFFVPIHNDDCFFSRPYESCKISKGPRRNVFSKLVHHQYKSFPPDRFLSDGNKKHNWVQ